MLNEAYREMTTLTSVDTFFKEKYLEKGEYIAELSCEEVRTVFGLWGKLDQVLMEEELKKHLDNGSVKDLNNIFNLESLFFDEGMDISLLTANRYFKMVGHNHDYFEIEFVLEGSAAHSSDEHKVMLKKGDMVLIPPGTYHNTQPIEDATIVDLEIRFSTFEKTFQDILAANMPISSYFRWSLYGVERKKPIILEDVIDETIIDLLTILWNENKCKKLMAGRKCVHLTKVLLYHLVEVVKENQVTLLSELQNEEIYLIRRYMLENLDTVTLAALAKEFHRSDSAISRYIKSKSGMGFAELLQNMRLEYATELLLTTDKNVAQIGNIVGYAGESHFIASFKKKYNQTPLQYRRNRMHIRA